MRSSAVLLVMGFFLFAIKIVVVLWDECRGWAYGNFVDRSLSVYLYGVLR